MNLNLTQESMTPTYQGNEETEAILQVKGRHDPCVVPRAVPIVEAMAAITLADFVLLNRTIKL